MFKPCIDCGVVSDANRCPEHRKKRDQDRQRQHPKESSTARGYDAAWKRISEQARRLQPFCSVCGSADDLTCDHSAEAWQAWIDKRPIKLEMVDVLCRPCNTAKGSPFKDHGDDPRAGSTRPTAGQALGVTLRRLPTQEERQR